MYLAEIIIIPDDYDLLKYNAQTTNPIQYGVQRIKRTDVNSCRLIDIIRSLEKAVFLTLDGVEWQVYVLSIPDGFQQLNW